VEAQACRTLFRDEACRARVVDGYLQAERLARHDPFLPLALAAFLIDTGDAAGARRAAERALAIEPEAVLPRLLLADAFLETGSNADLRRAAELLADARERAATWSGWSDGFYGRQLLRPDPRIFERLERKLADTSEPRPREAPGPP
jgi:predicted Zn-dependent protease